MQCHNRHPPLGHASLTHSNMLPSPDDLNISLRLKTITRPISSKKTYHMRKCPASERKFRMRKIKKRECMPAFVQHEAKEDVAHSPK